MEVCRAALPPEGAFTAPLPIFAFSAAAIALLCVGGVAGVLGKGFPQRFPDFSTERVVVGDWRNGVCFNEGANRIEDWNLADCTRTHGFATNVLLWGDSFAAHYVSGLEANAEKIQANVIQYTYAGCPPNLSYFSYARPACTRFNERALSIIREANIQAVILSGRWTDYQARGFDGLQKTIDRLRDMGVKVYVIGQSPEFIADVQKIAFFARRDHVANTSWPMAMDPDINKQVQPFVKGLISSIRWPICATRPAVPTPTPAPGSFSTSTTVISLRPARRSPSRNTGQALPPATKSRRQNRNRGPAPREPESVCFEDRFAIARRPNLMVTRARAGMM